MLPPGRLNPPDVGVRGRHRRMLFMKKLLYAAPVLIAGLLTPSLADSVRETNLSPDASALTTHTHEDDDNDNLNKFYVEVVVKRPNGTPLPDTPVLLRGPNPESFPQKGVTNAKGIVVFWDLIAGTYEFEASRPNFTFQDQPRSVTLPNLTGPRSPQARINLVGQRSSYVISGRVVNGKGAPIYGQTIYLNNNGGEHISACATDSKGYYEFNGVPAAGYHLQPKGIAGYRFDATDKPSGVPAAGPTGPDVRVDFTRTVIPPPEAKSPSGNSS